MISLSTIFNDYDSAHIQSNFFQDFFQDPALN